MPAALCYSCQHQRDIKSPSDGSAKQVGDQDEEEDNDEVTEYGLRDYTAPEVEPIGDPNNGQQTETESDQFEDA